MNEVICVMGCIAFKDDLTRKIQLWPSKKIKYEVVRKDKYGYYLKNHENVYLVSKKIFLSNFGNLV